MPGARIFTSRDFDRFIRKERVDDAALIVAVEAIEGGRADADLGGGVFKQRIARRGGGKSGGYRTVVVFREGDRAVFIEGFAKNDRSTHSPDELRSLREIAREFLSRTDLQIEQAIAIGRLRQIEREDDEDN